VDICASCAKARAHVNSHNSVLVQIKAAETIPGSQRTDKLCSSCSTMRGVRYDCLHCERSICENCYGDNANLLREGHDHRLFRRVQVPNVSIVSISKELARSSSSDNHDLVGYCGRCLNRKRLPFSYMYIYILYARTEIKQSGPIPPRCSARVV
jgi:hypothetical protein